MLEARDLTKYYSAIPAVRGLSFTLTPGGVLGLLGPNGSGKSTTVSILAANIGYVPEEAVLYTYLTGPEYLTLVGQLRELPPRTIEARIDGFLSLFDLKDDQHAPMSAYSKGMRQKILISAALLHDPSIVILDEPNSGLDVTTTLVLRSLVQTLAAEGRMVIYSSHVLESVERVATDVIILNEGKVVAHDSVSRLRELLELPSLEHVFRQLVIETDIDRMARDLVGVMKM
jgi:ABC-2 type transport system ATP-binding protein